MPGFFRGQRVILNSSNADINEQTVTEQFRGILYITDKRVIFQATRNGFEKPHTSLTSIAPYSNAADLQYGSATHSLLVPDGELVYRVMKVLQK
jgi:hypothetical protein